MATVLNKGEVTLTDQNVKYKVHVYTVYLELPVTDVHILHKVKVKVHQ